MSLNVDNTWIDTVRIVQIPYGTVDILGTVMAAETPVTYLTHWGSGTNWTVVFLCSITLEKDFNPTTDYTSFSIIVNLEEQAEDDIQVINYNQKTNHHYRPEWSHFMSFPELV